MKEIIFLSVITILLPLLIILRKKLKTKQKIFTYITFSILFIGLFSSSVLADTNGAGVQGICIYSDIFMSNERGSDRIDWEMHLYISNSTNPYMAKGTWSVFLYNISDLPDTNIINSRNLTESDMFVCRGVIPATVQAYGSSASSYSTQKSWDYSYIMNNSKGTFGARWYISNPNSEGVHFSGYVSNYDYGQSFSNTDYKSGASIASYLYYSFEPTIILNSEFYNFDNTRCEIWDNTTCEWNEFSLSNILLQHPTYKMRIYDIETNNLIYEDTSFVNYSTYRTVSIDTVKLINNAGEPVYFHISEVTTSYNNNTYFNSPDLVTMFLGAKNSSDYSCLDFDDFDSLLLTPEYDLVPATTPENETAYPENYAMVNGTVPDPDYDYLSADDLNYFSVYPNSATSQADWIWSFEDRYPSGSAYVSGSSSSPYSNLYYDDTNYYTVESSSDKIQTDYVWSYGRWYPIHSVNINGTSYGLYSYMDVDDDYHYSIYGNTENFLADYEWYSGAWHVSYAYLVNGTSPDPYWYMDMADGNSYTITANSSSYSGGFLQTLSSKYPNFASFINGSSVDPYTNMEFDDTNYYTIESNTDSTQVDYVWLNGTWYPLSSVFIDGTTGSPHSYLEFDDSDFFVVTSDSDSVVSDYIWMNGNWYPISSAFNYGSSSDPYSDLENEGTDFYTIVSGTYSKNVVDYIWMNSQWYPITVEFNYGSSSDPYSDMETDDTNYYTIASENSSQILSDYIWMGGNWYPLNAVYENGTSSDPYSDLQYDDTAYYTITPEEDSTQVDYVWMNSQWYPINAVFVNGTSDDPYSNMDADDSNYFVITPNTESTQVDYVWSHDDSYPTSSTFVNGTGNNPYSYMSADDMNYYYITANIDNEQVDYVWLSDNWYPINAVFVNGTSSDPYSHMEIDDENHYTINSEWYNETENPFENQNETWYPSATSITNGTWDSGTIPTSINADDTTYYIIDCNTASTFLHYNSATYTTTPDQIVITKGTYSGALANLNLNDDNTVDFTCATGYSYSDGSDFVDSQSDVDSTADIGTHDVFNDLKATDGTYDLMSEANMGSSATDYKDFVDATSNLHAPTDLGTHSSFSEMQDEDLVYNTMTEADSETGTGTFGESFGSGSSYRTMSANYMYGGAYLATYTGEVASATFYGRGGSATNGKMVICADGGTILTNGVSASFAISTTAGAKTGSWSAGSRPTVTSGTTYWIMLVVQGTTRFYYYGTINGDSRTDTSNSYTTPTSPTDAVEGTDQWRQCYATVNVIDYDIDLEVGWSGAPYSETNEYLCVYGGTQDAEAMKVDIWTGSWTNVISDVATGWNNYSISSYLTDETVEIRFVTTGTNDLVQSTWLVDTVLLHCWSDAVTNYKIALEMQFSTVNYTAIDEIRIKTGTFSGSEDINVKYWDGDSWEAITSDLTASAWNNYSVSPTSANFYVRFSGGTETGDTTQDTWNVDSVMLWGAIIQSAVYTIDQYVEFDYSVLGSSGNITSRNDITDITVDWRFYSNVSQTIVCSAWNYDTTTWTQLSSSNPTSETYYTDSALSNSHLQNDVNNLHFRFKVYGYSTTAGFKSYFDQIKLTLTYDNKNDPHYNYYNYLAMYWEFDLGQLIDDGNMTSKAGITDTYFTVMTSFNTTQSESFYYYGWDWVNSEWDLIGTVTPTTYTTFQTTYSNFFDNLDYWSSDLKVRVRFVREVTKTDTKTNTGGFNLYFDLVRMEISYNNIRESTYNWYHFIDGYIEFDLSDLYDNGNITSKADFMALYYTLIWKTNISEAVYWRIWDWTANEWDLLFSDTQTSFATDSGSFLTDHIQASTYLVRICFNTTHTELDSAINHGIQLQIDLAELKTWYENHQTPTYNWFYYIDGYLSLDLYDLYTSGNMTSLSDFMDTTFSYLWRTNVSESVSFYAYDFTDSEWDFIATDTQTDFDTDTNQTLFDDTRYFNATYGARFRFVTEYTTSNTTENSSIKLEFDRINLGVWYENHNLPTYDWYHYIDGYIEFDLSGLEDLGNITSIADFMNSVFSYLWKTNISESVSFYVYDFTHLEWDFVATDTQTAFTLDTNQTLFDNFADYFNATYGARFRFVTDHIDTNTTENSGIQLEFDLAELGLWYENHHTPTYDWLNEIDGYFELNLSSLYYGGNITSINDFMSTSFYYRWMTDWDEDSMFYIYNWTSASWDLLSTDTHFKAFGTNSAGKEFDNFADYFNPTTYTARFRFNSTYLYENATENDDVDMEFDWVNLNMWYENHHTPVYNWTHTIDGYLEFNISSLYYGGNITSISDLMDSVFSYIWKTNISESVTFYVYDWTNTEWDIVAVDTQTVFDTDTNQTLFDNFADYFDDTTYKARFKFVTDHFTENDTVADGIELEFDLAELGLWYENHHTPTYDWTHMIDGYLEFNISSLYYDGNITSISDLMESVFSYRWKTNISESVAFYVYDWTHTEWDIVAVDTQTSFATDVNQTVFDNFADYFDDTTYKARFKFVTDYLDENTTVSDGIELEFDLMKLNLWYENHYTPVYNWTHEIDGYLQFNLTSLYDAGNITSISDFMDSTFSYLWKTNVSESVEFYVYNWTSATWNIISVDTQTSFETDINQTVFDNFVNYFNSTHYLARVRFVTDHFDENTTENSGIELQFDMMNLHLWYENHQTPTYDWFYYIDGYLQFNFTDLYTSGNITSISDFVDSDFEYLWKTNESESVDFYVYDWDSAIWDFVATDTQTSFITDTNDTLFDNFDDYFNDTSYLSRFRFITEYIIENTTIESGISLQYDMVNLTITYTNHNTGGTTWYHFIDGYFEVDFSDLESEGNITSIADLMDSTFQYRWKTNISNPVYFYAYNWSSSTWNIMAIDTQTVLSTDTNATTFDDLDYFNGASYTARFRFATNYTDMVSQQNHSIQLEFDLITLNLWYENHYLPVYDWYHYIDGYLEFNLSDLESAGNITSIADFMNSSLSWLWCTNVSNEVYFYVYNWTSATWDFICVDTQTSFILDTNATVFDNFADYWNSTEYTARFRFVTNYFDGNTTENSTIKLQFDVLNLGMWYENHLLPTYNWTHTIDGYLQFDLSNLYVAGNITSISDFMESTLTWIWKTNISESVAFYVYNWTSASWNIILVDTQTSFGTDINDTVFDDLDYYNSTSFLARVRFVTDYEYTNSTINTGINLEFDVMRLGLWYENHHLPTYDYFHFIDGYLEFNLSEYYDCGNMTSRNDITDSFFSYLWKTNISETVYYYAYDWDSVEWDLIGSGIRTSFGTDTSEIFDDVRYYNPTTFLSRFRFVTEYIDTNTTVNSGIRLDFDLTELEFTYDRHYNLYEWNISAMFTWNYTDDFDFNDDWDWIWYTDMIYAYYTNITVDSLSIEFKYNDTAYTVFHEGIYTTLTEISNLTQSKYYLNNTDEKFIMTLNVSKLGDSDDYYGFFFEFANMSVYYKDLNLWYWTYLSSDDYLVYPYNFMLNNISDAYPMGSPLIYLSYNITDIYGNYLLNATTLPDFDDYIVLNYTDPETRTCLISYADQQGNYIDFFEYKTRINGTLIYEPYFYREVSDWVNISVYDRFNEYITSTTYQIEREDNWIPIQITLQSLKIYNQQSEFAWFNLTQNPVTSYYWSEWLAPNEITEFKLISGDYTINLTEYETMTTTLYNYTLIGDDILLVFSNNTIASVAGISNSILSLREYLTQLYQNVVFSEFLDWTEINRSYTFIENYVGAWKFVNSYRDTSVEVIFSYGNESDSIIIGAGDTQSRILPLNGVEYHIEDLETGENLSDWEDLPINKTVNIGSYEETIPITPEQIRSANNTVWIIGGILILVLFLFSVWMFYVRSKLDPKQSVNRKVFIDRDTIRYQAKKKGRRGGIYNFKRLIA